jgi:hypothetical protein
MGHPSVYPTGATLYDPQRAWSGYTLFQATEHGAVLVDMNGHVVREWPELHGFPIKSCPAAPSWPQRRARPALRHAGYARSDPGGLGRQRHLEIRPL